MTAFVSRMLERESELIAEEAEWLRKEMELKELPDFSGRDVGLDLLWWEKKIDAMSTSKALRALSTVWGLPQLRPLLPGLIERTKGVLFDREASVDAEAILAGTLSDDFQQLSGYWESTLYAVGTVAQEEQRQRILETLIADPELVRAEIARYWRECRFPEAELAERIEAMPADHLERARRLAIGLKDAPDHEPFLPLDPMRDLPGLSELRFDHLLQAPSELGSERVERALVGLGMNALRHSKRSVIEFDDIEEARSADEWVREVRRVIRHPECFDAESHDEDVAGDCISLPVSENALAELWARYERSPLRAGLGYLDEFGDRTGAIVLRLDAVQDGRAYSLEAVMPLSRRPDEEADENSFALAAAEVERILGPAARKTLTGPLEEVEHVRSPQFAPVEKLDKLPPLQLNDRCAHPRADWTAAANELRLACPDCGRAAIERVPLHRIPDAAFPTLGLPPLDHHSYISHRRFCQAALDLPVLELDPSVPPPVGAVRAVDALRAAEGFLDPVKIRGELIRPQQAPAAKPRRVSDAMNRR